MGHYIVIRECNLNDIKQINNVIRRAYLSNVFSSWFSALMKEITFQLIVVFAAIMFIFVGVPFFYCIASIPLALILMFITIYSFLLMKSIELSNKRPLQCWVAEAYEQRYLTDNPEKLKHIITTEENLKNELTDLFSYRKKIIGTVSVTKSVSVEHSLWLHKLAVDKSYRRKGVGLALIKTAQKWGVQNHYDLIHLAIAECQEHARYIFAKAGFELKQMYHKQIFSSVITIIMYQLEYELKKTFK